MLGRRSIWSNERVIELAKNFVATTDEVWRLQNGNDPECRHFQKISEVGHYRKHKSTRQGVYVCTPSGKLLGSMNTHNVDAVIEMLVSGLKQYREMSTDERKLAPDEEFRPTHRWEESFPVQGLDLTMYARDLPESCNPDDEACVSWNQDRVWFSRSEARQFLPPTRAQIVEGASYKVPNELVSRIARFSIVDTVKGQTSYYTLDQVRQSSLTVHIDDVIESNVKISIHGTTHAESPESRGRDYQHGIQTQVLGRATYNFQAESFSDFQMLALGTRWGRTVYNGRRRQLDETPVGFVFQLTNSEAPVIAPAFLFAYRAPWVKRPK